jgi:RimJ/RimL family protein N-acetyltransferase
MNGFGPWAAIYKATGSSVGRTGLDVPEDGPGGDKIEVGFELHKAWWGRGLATDGALAALRFGFAHHGAWSASSVSRPRHTSLLAESWRRPDLSTKAHATG